MPYFKLILLTFSLISFHAFAALGQEEKPANVEESSQVRRERIPSPPPPPPEPIDCFYSRPQEYPRYYVAECEVLDSKKEKKKCAEEKMIQLIYQSVTELSIPEEELTKTTAVIQFVIQKDGTASGFKVVRGIHPQFDTVALATVQQLKKWVPATINGKAVPMTYNVPVKYKKE